MARRKHVYCKNISEQPQEVKHRLLADLAVVPMAPGGFTDVVQGKFVFPVEAICRVPIGVWELMPGLGKKAWAVEVTHDDFMQALHDERSHMASKIEQTVAKKVRARLEREFDGKLEAALKKQAAAPKKESGIGRTDVNVA